VGSWPYVASRRDAIEWRSSNAPHWVSEAAESDRSLSLEAFALDDESSFFDVIRRNSDGRAIRRQLIKAGPTFWIVVDSFTAPDDGTAETVWRFSPDLSLQASSTLGFELSSIDRKVSMGLASTGDLHVEADDGRADWNSGLISAGEIVRSPALRVLTGTDHEPVVTVFKLLDLPDASDAIESVDLRWNNQTDWKVYVSDHGDKSIVVERRAKHIVVNRTGMSSIEVQLSAGTPELGTEAMQQALDAYESAAHRYGEPFQLMLGRRTKLTGVIVAVAALQMVLFFIVRRRFHHRWRPILTVSVSIWLGLSLFLGLNVVA
jgi:hypothetical protein